MAGKIRAAVIGLGWSGKEHLKGYLACADAEVAAICDWDETALVKVAKDFGVARTYLDYKEMIACDDIDVVSVCVPNYEHMPLTLDCLNLGKHVLCEKPPALNAAEARQMADTATARSLTLMYALVMRFQQETRFVKERVVAGELGDIYLGKAGYTRRRGIPIGKDGWFVDKARAGGGALIDIGVHALDCVWYLMGTPQPVSVSGSAYSMFGHTLPKGVKFDVDDAAMAIIKFANGATLFLEATWAWNLPAEQIKKIAGTKGGASLGPLTLYTEDRGVTLDSTLGAGGMPAGYGGMSQNAFEAEVAHFISVVRGKTTSVATPEQGVQLMQMLDAVYASSASGAEVRI